MKKENINRIISGGTHLYREFPLKSATSKLETLKYNFKIKQEFEIF